MDLAWTVGDVAPTYAVPAHANGVVEMDLAWTVGRVGPTYAVPGP